jgi:hypothetical protein
VGGSGSTGGGLWAGPLEGSGGVDCGGLTFATTPELARDAPQVTVGDVVELVRAQTDGPRIAFDPAGRLVAVVDADGRLVGTVVDMLGPLLRCMSGGFGYVAEVTGVTAGVPRVRVRPADMSVVERAVFTTAADDGDGPVTLEPSTARIDARPSIGGHTLGGGPVCELRALLRTGAQCDAAVVDGRARLTNRR